MDSATWCWTPAAASAARRLRPEVSKNSNTALSSNEGELARSIITCVPAMASLSPSPVIVLMPLLGEPATTSWPPWRRMATVFEPIRPVPPMTTIFMVCAPVPTPLRAAASARRVGTYKVTTPIQIRKSSNDADARLAADEGHQVLVDRVGVGGEHSVRE